MNPFFEEWYGQCAKIKSFFMVLFLKFISVNSVSCLIPEKRFFNVTPKPFGVPGGVSVTKSNRMISGDSWKRTKIAHPCTKNFEFVIANKIIFTQWIVTVN